MAGLPRLSPLYPRSGRQSWLPECRLWANRRRRACTPLANFLSDGLAFTLKGQSDQNFSLPSATAASRRRACVLSG
jgi:hypothetical protein